jgi:drug/metabolite transporter (DMT)-like permease
MRKSRRLQAILALILVNVLWGISFPLMRMINELMDRAVPAWPGTTSGAAALVDQSTRASFYMALRFTIAMVLLATAMPSLFRRLTRAEWLMGMGVGLPFAAGFLLQVAGLNELPASRSGFLTSLCVVFTPLLIIAVERRWPRPAVVMGAAIALLGTAFLTGLLVPDRRFGLHLAADSSSPLGIGDALTVAAAFLFGFQIIAIDVFARRMTSERLTPGMFLAVIVVAVVVFVASASLRPVPAGPSAWAGLLMHGPFLPLTAITSVFCSALAFRLMNTYQPEVSPVQAASIYTLEPVFATLWAMWLPGVLSPLVGLDYPSEGADQMLVLGGALIVLGNIVSLGAPHGVPAVASIEREPGATSGLSASDIEAG